MPATRLPLGFSSFDDYLARRLSHATRKSLRRKFRALAGAPPLTMTVTHDLGDAAEEALALYEQVYARSKLQFEHLNKAFLQQLAVLLPERVRFFLWRQEGRLVAFSLCLVHDGVLYDEYLGLDYRVALDLHLYFVTFRDVLTWAIAQGLHTYCSTPLNYEPKLHLGFELAPLDLYLTVLPLPLHRLMRPWLKYLSPARAEPALARFGNAAEMNPES
jgi:predicted N-acyltransferase